MLYIDPTGAVLELTGADADRRRSFEVLQEAAGPEGANLLFTRNDGDRTFVDYSGREHDRLAATGPFGVILADIIDDRRVVELTWGTSFRDRNGTHTVASFGGAATAGMEETLNGNVQIFLAPNAEVIVSRSTFSIGGPKSRTGQPLLFTNGIILAHELGHAWANLRGDSLYYSQASDPMAVETENMVRRRMGVDERARH